MRKKNEEIFTKFSKILKKFEGTHNYHNYTVEKKVGDKSCNRYILSMNLERIKNEEIIKTLGGKQPRDQYFKVTLHGQSFVYHQIRKMIGMCIQIFQQNEGDGFMIDNSFCANRIPVWLAPSEGLLLNELKFDAYNRKHDIPEKIELTEEEYGNIEEFKRRVIYREVIESNEERYVFEEFLQERLGGNGFMMRKRDERSRKKLEEKTEEKTQEKIEEKVVEN